MKLPVLFVLLVGAELASAAEHVKATASSSYSGRDPINAVNGSGLRDGAHDNELNSAWHSGAGQNPWFRVDLGRSQSVKWMKVWNLNWGPYTDRGIRQADIYWSNAGEDPGNPVEHPENWTLAIEDQKFTRASHWPDYGRNPNRRMPDVVRLGELTARYICLKIDANFNKTGRGYCGISEIQFSADRFQEPEPVEPDVVVGPSLELLRVGETIDLHSRFLSPENETRSKLIDPTRIAYAEVIQHPRRLASPVPLEVRAIRAVGKGPKHAHATPDRLLVPEVTEGRPAPGKRVKRGLHTIYLPTDWEPQKEFPIVVEYPGNQFYDKFCYSPGLTEYGRIGWGLTKNLGDPKTAGDGFIWLNLPFVNEQGTEQNSGWGDREKTVEYFLKTIRMVCEKLGGDPDAVVFTGFSRGQLAANHIGLRRPELAGLVRAWHRNPTKRAPRDRGGWHDSFVGQNDRIDRHYQGQMICPVASVPMGGMAHVDCGFLEDRPQAVASREWLAEALRDDFDPLRNELYNIWPQPDGSLHIANKHGGSFDVFRPEFAAIHCKDKPTTSRLKWTHPIYNLPAWKLADGTVEADLFKLGDVISLSKPKIAREGDAIIWTFDDERLTLTARVSLPEGRAEPRIDYQVKIKGEGYYTFGYTGAPSLELDNVARLWQPQVWDGRRLPEQSFLIGDDHCTIPGCLVEHTRDVSFQPANGNSGKLDGRPTFRTVGVMADPWQFPYEMPQSRNRKFGVTIRNSDGDVQPMVFAPFIGSDTHFKAGDVHRFAVQLVAQPQPLSETFEYVARNISGFCDKRENTLTTLNQTLDNMVDFALSKWAAFDTENKSSYYPDAKGTVKNVSCLHPLSVALVTDNARLFHEQTVPIMEYLLSREKFLFAIDESGLNHSQKPSRNMAGPAMPVSELAALHRLSQGGSSLFLEHARRLYAVDRRLNMNWITAGATWQRSLSLYRATGEAKWLEDAVTKANAYISERIDSPPVDFKEASDGTFFEYMVPWWKELYELYLETRDPRHLAAAHTGARRYAQFAWFYPSVPDRNITVNPRGLAPRRGRAEEDGKLPVPKESVPAWRVSDQGLICEGNGTVQRLGILIATHAPLFLRIARDTDDEFLRDIARSAVIGRYANFPGYHLNTRFSTAQEKPDFPLHKYDVLKPTTSIHYNHILPQVNLVIDYLMARAYDLSDGAIDFPAEFIEGYAYLQSKLYGSKPGKCYDETDLWPWMPKQLLTIDNVQANYIAARGADRVCLAFMNASDRPIDVTFTLNASHFQSIDGDFTSRVWKDNRPGTPIVVKNGVGTLTLSPKGITAMCIKGLSPKVSFQNKLSRTRPAAVQCGNDELEAAVLSFGPKLRWVYGYLKSEPGTVVEAEASVTSAGATQVISDDSYPFEFSAPIDPTTDAVRIQARLRKTIEADK